jgi:hypothetical protein
MFLFVVGIIHLPFFAQREVAAAEHDLNYIGLDGTFIRFFLVIFH